MDTKRQSIDQNLRKLDKTAGFSDLYAQDYNRNFKDIKDYIYLNGKKTVHRIVHLNFVTFVNLKIELLAFLGWP